ncbi:hypothetical protein DCAR_0728760 [Daucus carota subsp. sativus]|nr:hypothetical protein DCAR_0728760 [Daucus carota subsp. sativus]
MRFLVAGASACNLASSKLVVTSFNSTYFVRFNSQSFNITSSWSPMSSVDFCASREAKVKHKWMEYQGVNNWDGLLDPLDEDLKSEILRYGSFVQAAYRSFDFNTSSPGYGSCKFEREMVLTRCGLENCGYKVTKNLRATCGVQMPNWIERAPSWVTTRSSWIGYVAVCDDKDVIARLGRRDVVIAIRGTATCLEWIENLRTTLAPLQKCHVDHQLMVETGFLSLYMSQTDTCPSLRDTLKDEVARIIEMYGDEPLSITITGHSLGAALGTLAAHDINSSLKDLPLITVISFGGPRVGNNCFSKSLETDGIRILRIVNSNDVITKIPGFIINHSSKRNTLVPYGDGMAGWIRKRVHDTKWLYADVGKELRLCCNNPPSFNVGNIATCHDLKTYLELVDGIASSTCPLKDKAKKVLHGTEHEKRLLFR